jgi:hypothetical protein
MVKQIQLYFFPLVGQSFKSGGETSFPMEIAVAGIQVEGALLIYIRHHEATFSYR